MKLVNVNPLYIDYLQKNKNIANVMDSKFDSSHNGGRKYIGICFETQNFSYFIPIHKGSKSDYTFDKNMKKLPSNIEEKISILYKQYKEKIINLRKML